MKRLGVNIDHVATLRNARGGSHPSPIIVAKEAINFGADSITIHLREDRRHIKDNDLKKLSKIKIPINLEIACNYKMMKIALKNNPKFVCLVPEKRKEITTEGGLNLNKNRKYLKNIIKKIKKKRIRVSLFIEPQISAVENSFLLGADCIELHTGSFCNAVNNKKKGLAKSTFEKLKKCAQYGKNLGLDVHAGHGLTFKSTAIISKIKNISEFNIGHFIVSESIFLGMKNTIRKFKKIIN